MNRRSFCMTLGTFGAASFCPGNLFSDAGGYDLHEQQAKAFGTTVRIIVSHRNARTARLAMSAAIDELDLIESIMSIYRQESQLAQLNRLGTLPAPHRYLTQLLQQALAMSKRTNGAFDVTVQPLWKSYKEATNRGQHLNAESIEAVRKTVGYRNVEFVSNRVQLAGGSQITLNGIAQGFATDRVKRVLRERGIQHALVDVGELAGLGAKDDGKPWVVGIQHPRQRDSFASTTCLGDRCLATSGDYATPFSEDFSSHHVFDPRTGVSPAELASVSVLAPTATEADALATAFLVMGRKDSAAMLARHRNIDALFICKDGRMSTTAGFTRKETT